jgi:hypothetical protein
VFDNLRRLSDGEEPFEEAVKEIPFEVQETREPRGNFLGLTSGQRFILSLLLLGTVVILGLMCLMVTGKVFIF